MANEPAAPERRPLTDRQLQIAVMTAQGMSAAEIAGVLGISVGTVQNSRTRIRRRLGLPASDHLPEAMAEVVADAASRNERRLLSSLRRSVDAVEETVAALRVRAGHCARATDAVVRWEGGLVEQMADELQQFRDRWINQIGRSWEDR